MRRCCAPRHGGGRSPSHPGALPASSSAREPWPPAASLYRPQPRSGPGTRTGPPEPGWGGRRARGGGGGRDGDPLLPRGLRRGRAAEGTARQQVGSGAPPRFLPQPELKFGGLLCPPVKRAMIGRCPGSPEGVRLWLIKTASRK